MLMGHEKGPVERVLERDQKDKSEMSQGFILCMFLQGWHPAMIWCVTQGLKREIGLLRPKRTKVLNIVKFWVYHLENQTPSKVIDTVWNLIASN